MVRDLCYWKHELKKKKKHCVKNPVQCTEIRRSKSAFFSLNVVSAGGHHVYPEILKFCTMTLQLPTNQILDSRTWDRYIRPLQMSHSGFRKKWERLSTSLQQVYNKEWSRKFPNFRIRIRFIRYRYRYGPGSSLKLYYGSPGPALFFTLPEILNKFVLHLRNCYKQIIDWKEKFGNLILCQ